MAMNQSTTTQPTDANVGGVNLHKGFSRINESLAKLFDESGVKRSFTVPYIEKQSTADHVKAVGAAAKPAGGLTKNLLTTAHHSGGRGWGTGDGATVGHPAATLKQTIIPANDEHAIAAISATRSFLNDVAHLLGPDDPTVVAAKSQLGQIAQANGEGMHLLDFGVALQSLVTPPLKAVMQKHEAAKPGGAHARGTVPMQSQSDDATPDQTQQAAPQVPPTPQGAPAAPQQQQ